MAMPDSSVQKGSKNMQADLDYLDRQDPLDSQELLVVINLFANLEIMIPKTMLGAQAILERKEYLDQKNAEDTRRQDG